MKKYAVFGFLALSAAFLVFTLGYAFAQRRDTGAVTVSVSKEAAAYTVAPTQASAAAEQVSSEAETTAETIHYPLNINGALKEDLMTLPGIDETLAQSILDYRLKNGRFASTQELMNVYGIGEKRYAAIEDYITVLD